MLLTLSTGSYSGCANCNTGFTCLYQAATVLYLPVLADPSPVLSCLDALANVRAPLGDAVASCSARSSPDVTGQLTSV